MRRLLLSVIIGTVAAYAQNVGGSISQAATGGGSGTVTNVATTGPITGGPITTTGTVACPTCTTAAAALTSGQLLLGAAGQALAIGNLSGDVTTSGSAVTTLATVNAGPGLCGDATHVCQITTNGKGLTTSQSAVAITSGAVSSVFTRTGAVVAASGDYTLDLIGSPAANSAFTMGAFTDTHTWNAATGAAANLFTLTDTASNTGTGYVGTIGTAASSSALPFQVLTRGVQSFFIDNSGEHIVSSTNPFFEEQYSTDTTGPKLDFRKARGTQGTPTAVASNDQTFFFQGDGYNGAGYTTYQQIFGTVSGTGGTLQFRTNNGTAVTQAAIVDGGQDWAFAHNVSVGRGGATGSSSIGLDIYGSSVHELLATAAAPVITNGGTAGSTSYSYKVVAKYFDGTHSPVSAAGSTATGNATLTAGNFNTVTWTGVSNAYCYDVYVSSPTTNLISQCNTGTTYNDIGTTVSSGSGSTVNNTGTIQVGGYIKSGVSTNTDLAGSVTLSSGSGTYTFVGSYASAPICTATDTTAAAAVKASATTTVLTLTGTTTDVINYICVGRN